MKIRLSIFSILLHGFFIVAANLFSIAIAFALIQIASLSAGKLMQSLIALSINIVIYIGVFKIMRAVQRELIEINDIAKMTTVYLISLAMLPAAFYPMYFLTQGHWSTFENVLAVWPFQIVANGICLLLNYSIVKKSPIG